MPTIVRCPSGKQDIIHTLSKDVSQWKHIWLYTHCIRVSFIYVYIYTIYIRINIFNMFLLWHQTLCDPMPDVGVDLVLPGHPLPESIFDSRLSHHAKWKTLSITRWARSLELVAVQRRAPANFVVRNIRWISMIPLSSELLNQWHGTRTNSKWNEPSMHCQAENLSPYVRHGRIFHVIQVYPGCWSPPI